MPPFLRVDARVGARRVDQAEDGQLEALGQLHQTQGLAVALRARHAEVAVDFFLGVAALLMADDHDGQAIQLRQTAHDGRIVGKGAVAMQFMEIGQHQFDVVQRVDTLGMTGELGNLPGAEIREHRLCQLATLFLQFGDFFADVDLVIETDAAQLIDLGLQVGNRLFEIEEIEIHAGIPWAEKKRLF